MLIIYQCSTKSAIWAGYYYLMNFLGKLCKSWYFLCYRQQKEIGWPGCHTRPYTVSTLAPSLQRSVSSEGLWEMIGWICCGAIYDGCRSASHAGSCWRQWSRHTHRCRPRKKRYYILTTLPFKSTLHMFVFQKYCTVTAQNVHIFINIIMLWSLCFSK